MDRRLLFPPIAAIVCVHPASAQVSDAEKALRARADQFYQLEVNGEFRKAEAFVAEDTKDFYYNTGKPEILKFHIEKVDIDPDGVHAVVKVNLTTTMRSPVVGAMNFSSTSATTWKLDNGQWSWYLVQNADINTPFGKWHIGDLSSKLQAPPLPGLNGIDPSKVSGLVTIDRTSIELNGDGGASTVTITNHMPGAIDVKLASGGLPGLAVTIDKEKPASGETSTVTFKTVGGAKPAGKITIAADPIQQFVIDVKTK